MPPTPPESEYACHDHHHAQPGWAGTEPMLDFLYPRQALNLFKQLRTYKSGSLKKKRKRRLSDLTVLRQYSSVATGNEPVPSESLVPSNNDENTDVVSECLTQLYRVFISEDLQHEYAWELYSKLPLDQRSPDINIAMLRLMATSPTNTNAQRCLVLFSLLPDDFRQSWGFRTAVLSNILLERVGEAVKTHQMALQQLVDGDIGSSLLFAHLFLTRQWLLAMEMHNSFAKSRTSEGLMREEKILWENLAEVEGLENVRDSFISFVEDSINTEDTLRSTRHSIFQGLCMRAFPADIKREAEEVRKLLVRLDRKNFPTGEVYEYVLMNCLQKQPGRTQYNRDNSFTTNAWKMWCCKGDDFRPSERLLYKFLREMCWDKRTKGLASIESVAAIWRKQYSKLTNEAILKLMQTYAMMGNIREVYKYFREYERNNNDMPMTYEPFKRLALLHGQRGEVEECVRLFHRMRTIYGKEPRKYFWNMMLLACAKNDDLDGCYRVIEEIERGGMQPDAVTLGPIMNLLAQRGDVIAVRNFLQIAEERKTRISTYMVGALVLAHINNNELNAAESLAVEAAEVKEDAPDKLDGSLTKMWNSLLTAYALRKDDKTVSRLFKQMTKHNIEPDELTFATFMQTLAGKHQTQTAETIFRRALTINNVRVTAFHYAILMVGYVNQSMYERAIMINNQMKKRGIKDTTNTRMALIKAVTLLNEETNRTENNKDKSDRLETAERIVDKTIRLPGSYHRIDSEPYFGLQYEGGPDASSILPASYLMMLYSRTNSLQAARELFEKHISTPDGSATGRADGSFRLLTAIMRMYRLEQDWTSLEKCWNIAKKEADRLAVMPEARLPYKSLETLSQQQTVQDDLTRNETITFPKPEQKSPVNKMLEDFNTTQARFETIHQEFKTLLTVEMKSDNEAATGREDVAADVDANEAKTAVGNQELTDGEATSDGEALSIYESIKRYEEPGDAEISAIANTNSQHYNSKPVSSAESNQTTSTSIDEVVEPLRIAAARKTLISRPLAIYIRGLASQERFTDIANTVCITIRKGYSLDMHAWNTFIEVMARGGFIETACALCERILMGAWKGWRNRANLAQFRPDGSVIDPPIWLRKRNNQAHGLRFTNVKWPEPGVLMPYYRTFVFLHQQFLLLQESGVLDQDDPEENKTANFESQRLNETIDTDVSETNSDNGLDGSPLAYDDLQEKFHERNDEKEESTTLYRPHAFYDAEEPMAGESDAEIESLSDNPALTAPEAAAAAIARAPQIGPAMCPFILASMESKALPTYKRLTNLAPQTVMAVEDLPPVPDRLQEVYLKRFEGH